MGPDRVFHDPCWFPDRIDWRNGLIRLIHVDHPTLARSAFLDGRTPLTRDETAPRVIQLRRFIAAIGDVQGDARWVLHESFCGSTLLSRALTIPGKALCLREPQVLIDLADWRQSLDNAADRELYLATLNAVVAKLSQRWPDGAPVVIKPSNWANTIATDLLRASAGQRAMAVQNTPEAFLVAVLRGGRDRLRYVLELRSHLLAARPRIAVAIADALGPTTGTLDDAVAMVAQCHWLQRTILQEVVGTPETQQNMLVLRFPEWLAAPLENVTRAEHALGLAIPADTIARSVADAVLHYSKNDDNALFDKEAEDAASSRVRAIYAKSIEAALMTLDSYAAPVADIDKRQIDAA